MVVSVAEVMLPKESAGRNLVSTSTTAQAGSVDMEVMVWEMSEPAMSRQATAEAALIVCRERRWNNGTGGARKRMASLCVLSYHASMKSLQVDIAQHIVRRYPRTAKISGKRSRSAWTKEKLNESCAEKVKAPRTKSTWKPEGLNDQRVMQNPQVKPTQCRGLRGVTASRGTGGSRQGEVWSQSSEFNCITTFVTDARCSTTGGGMQGIGQWQVGYRLENNCGAWRMCQPWSAPLRYCDSVRRVCSTGSERLNTCWWMLVGDVQVCDAYSGKTTSSWA